MVALVWDKAVTVRCFETCLSKMWLNFWQGFQAENSNLPNVFLVLHLVSWQTKRSFSAPSPQEPLRLYLHPFTVARGLAARHLHGKEFTAA